MAEVFLATKIGAEGWQKPVVFKRILPFLADRADFRRLFFNEASIATKLTHPNLVHVYDYLEIDDQLCIVEEYLDGKDLRAVLQQSSTPLSWPCVTYIGFELLKALGHLHQQSPPIFHRDISPQNVMITFTGQVKLIDFGIARFSDEHEPIDQFKGRRAYLAPEYLERRQYDQASEIFSVGKIILETLKKNSSHDLPPRLVEIFEKCIVVDPLRRYSSVDELQLELARFLSENAATAKQAEQQLSMQMQCRFPRPEDRQHAMLSETLVELQPSWKQRLISPLLPVVLSLLLIAAVVMWPESTAVFSNWANHRLALQTNSVAPEQNSVIKASDSVALSTPRGNGFLQVDTFPWSSVYLNGRFLGVTPLKSLSVPSGAYQLYLVTRDGRSLDLPLEIKSGNTQRLFRQIP